MRYGAMTRSEATLDWYGKSPYVASHGSRTCPLALVKRAAEIEGRSVSEFVVSAAREAAHRALGEAEIIRLSAAGQRAFADAILGPPEPSEELKRAFENHRRLIRDVR